MRMILQAICLSSFLLGGIASADSEGDAYQIGAGDSVSVQVFDETELSGAFSIGEDGFIDYPLLGRVNVAGKTAGGLDDTLTAALGERFVRDPQIQVTVTKFGSQPVQVLGAVKKPGLVHLEGRTTVLDVISKSGGVADGSVAEVRIQFKDQSKGAITVQIDDLVKNESANVVLSAGDVVHVSEGLVVYMSGQVAKPGAVSYNDGLTITQALTRAGGATRLAKTREAYILRGEQRISINVKKILKGKAADVTLRPDDQVVLSESVF